MTGVGRWWRRWLGLLAMVWMLLGGTALAQPHTHTDRDLADTRGMALTLPPVSSEYTTVRRGTLTIRYATRIEPMVRGALEHAESDLATVARQIGTATLPSVEVRLVPDTDAMRTYAPRELPPPAYASGVAYPSMRLVLVATRAAGTLEAINVRQVLRHELSHIVFGEAVGDAPMPRWLTEGLAVEQSAEHSFDRFQRLAVASYSRGIVPLRELDRGFVTESADGVSVAYAQSADFVGWLLRKEGAARFGVMLAHVKGGMPFEDAAREAYGQSFASLESDWRRDLHSRFAFAPLWAGTGLVTIAGMVLVVVAMVRRRKKSKTIVSRWEREERRRAEALARLIPTRWTVLRPGWVVLEGGRKDAGTDLPN